MITNVMRIQENEVEALKRIAASTDDGPVLMLNQNRYSREAEYPTGPEYLSYIRILEATVGRVGGKVLWRSTSTACLSDANTTAFTKYWRFGIQATNRSSNFPNLTGGPNASVTRSLR